MTDGGEGWTEEEIEWMIADRERIENRWQRSREDVMAAVREGRM